MPDQSSQRWTHDLANEALFGNSQKRGTMGRFNQMRFERDMIAERNCRSNWLISSETPGDSSTSKQRR